MRSGIILDQQEIKSDTQSQFIFYIKSSLVTHQRYFYGILLYLGYLPHPRRPRGSQSGRGKKPEERFQARVEEPLATDSRRAICKRSGECWLLIGHKKCIVLLCPIGEQHLLSSFRAFVHDRYCLAILVLRVYTKSLTRKSACCKNKFLFKMAVY